MLSKLFGSCLCCFNMTIFIFNDFIITTQKNIFCFIFIKDKKANEKKYKKVEMKSPDERLLERVIKVVNAHLNDPGLTTDLIAREVGLSRVHLYRKLKELTNQSARDYVRNIRLTKAAELLSSKKMAVSEVANLVGFSNANNFATAFRELFGVTPTQYMEQHIEKKE